jgi:glucosamine--fructose-6-phosphate aminotransferase (isomerizing)
MTPLLGNILNQPEALRTVSAYQFGEGRASLEQAAEFLKSKKRIVLSGMGASYFACVAFQSMLAGSRFDVVCVETAELLYFTPVAIDEDTAVVLISRSGESIEVTKLLDRLVNAGIPVLGIVNVLESSLAKRASYCVHLHSPADQLVAIQTYTSTLAVFSLIHAAMTGELDSARNELARTVEILKAFLPGWVERRGEWHSFLEGNWPLYITGRGAAMGAVLEGVLLMHETAKFPAVGMSVPQFRHGPVEVVDANFRLVVIGTQAATEELDSMLATDIVAMGGQARWIGPAGKATPLCSWPAEVPWRFSSIVETVPLQIVAYTKAELRGLRPGDFRWATAVTSSESGFCPQS